MVGLEPKRTALRSLESNGIAESFVKTMKREYINGLTAEMNLAEAFNTITNGIRTMHGDTVRPWNICAGGLAVG